MSDTKPQAKHFPVKKTPMLPPGTFSGKTALITGGGTGLGKAMALMLGTLGASVAILGRRLHVLEQTAKELESQTGNRVLACSADVRDPAAVKSAIDLVEKELGLPTIIVNNAAGNFISPTERLSPNAFKTIIDIVLNGTANVTLDMGKRLIAAQKGASFLTITTTYTYRGSAFVVPSATAKAGIENMVRSLASEWGRYGIRLNCVAPGPIDTGTDGGAWSRLDPTGAFKDVAIDKLPVGRFGDPAEVSNLACYLLSDYSSFITGETILLDGGELGFGAGEFNNLTQVSNEQWDLMEKMIRQSNAKDKAKPKL
ncbi:2,4-dienoyl-CoA reductase, mitochondrial-like [Bradysia coprophila]|uniref:2,4-dienoyl-CoA reductase, mitochondrial-like n=1 Tax=Bradysia coprophila TaxID=38358 RepID=UPI00187DD6EE|nr:2,4-dienoyl-CoA reductase, mitochondrial-like [Bradysia coprophila]